MAHKMFMLSLVLIFCGISHNLCAEEVSPSPPAVRVEEKAPAAIANDSVAVQNIVFENDALLVVTDGKLPSYSLLRLNKPARLVIDLPGVSNQLKNQIYTSEAGPISAASVISYSDKLRLIIEAGQSMVFPDARIDSTPAGLVIHMSEGSNSAGVAKKTSYTPPGIQTNSAVSQFKPRTGGAVTSQGHVDSVTVEHNSATSRVKLNISGSCSISDPQVVLNGISVSLGDCIVPTNWQGNVDTAKAHPVVSSITLFPASAAKKVEAGMLIELNQRTKFSFSKDGQRLVIDLETDCTATSTAPAAVSHTKLSAAASSAKTVNKKYSGKKVTMEFDRAELRHVFRLLADVSGENFVIADDVTGVLSIKLKDVPWEQALDIIIRNNNLAIEHIGNVIEILTKQKKIERDKIENDIRLQETRQKLEEMTAKEVVEGMVAKTIQLKHVTAVKMSAALQIMLSQGDANVSTGQGQQVSQGQSQGQSQGTASVSSEVRRKFSSSITPEPNTNKIIVRDYISRIAEIEKLVKELDVPERQVMIEARIVVATSDFTKDFGIQWGAHVRDGSASVLGINSMDTGFGGLASAPPGLGQLGGASGIATGISFGRLASNLQLDLRLSAATAASMVKVVASPRIVTLNNEPAKIEQGQSTFVQTIDKLGIPSMTPVTATLKLDVTPTINSNNDSLKLKIDASDDSFSLPPPGAASVAINKRTATSTLLLKDGETVVIGGIFRDQNSDAESGVPFLKDIPLLGYLFKSTSTVSKREELLIFIRPRILDLI